MDNTKALLSQLHSELQTYQSLHEKTYAELVRKISVLNNQLEDNKIVLSELKLLEPGKQIYKKCGSILVKQNIETACSDVENRIEYISSELKRHNQMMQDIVKDMTKHLHFWNKFQQEDE